MKISTLTAMALVFPSCFAAPVHTTALDSLTARYAALAQRANAAPVAPPAPGVAAVAIRPDGWARITLPKPTGLAHKFAAHERRAQT
ncbi:hypothetical protein FAZ69_09055 [Trinickia terrae]|uniref:Uncharacterized protein n=1 Tax=Trinickia terrae TaxID=2571161 RepID=A0A4U1I9T8_9BURK|nr:hypothetical protein [Trinickia terrae]TKC90281.1 hypothetical protein FAZ69_09055 [Trinickia terrae]